MSTATRSVQDPMMTIEQVRDILKTNDGREGGDVVILDATYMMPQWARNARREFEACHIPGSRFFDIDAIADTTSALPHMVPTADQFADSVGKLGIGNDDLVVVYDAHGLMSAARAWWMFRLFGHDQVRVLDGGLPAWVSAELPVESGPGVEPDIKTFHATLRPHLLHRQDDVRRLSEDHGGDGAQIVDARASERFDGSTEDGWPGRRRGHIPGSLNVPFSGLLAPDSGKLLSSDRLRENFASAGVNIDTPITASCGSGITACVLALALYRLGKPSVAVYDGSWAEWGLDHTVPAEIGAARKTHDPE